MNYPNPENGLKNAHLDRTIILRVAENDCQPNQSAHVYTVDVILMSSDFSIAVNAVSSTSISHSDILNHILLLHTC